MQIYSDPTRADDPHAPPDVEVFYDDGSMSDIFNEDGSPVNPGWFWWPCFPGCLPDSDPVGPFDTEAMAIADAQEWEG